MLKPLEKYKQYYKISFCIIIFVSSFTSSFSQNDSTKQNLFMIARPTTDSILLRWAPSNYKYWNLGNRYGYNLVRYTIMQDSSLIKEPKRIDMTPLGIAPLPLDDWENIVKNNKYGGIAAQAIYGKSFEVDAGEGLSPQKVFNQAREKKQRFSFALYAADISPQVAKASGLWFTDHSAKNDEMYLYRVFLNLPDSLSNMNDTTFVYTGIRDYTPLPKPVEVTANFGDRIATLSWNSFVQDNIYIAWEVERSSDGKIFQPITIDPQVSILSQEATQSEYSYKYDSLAQNNKEFFYRVRGITSFGEYGPWSDLVSGKGVKKINAAPNITRHEIKGEKVSFNWTFPSEMEEYITGFKIIRSSNHKTDFEELISQLKPSTRSFIDKTPLGINYYKVVAYRDSTVRKVSFPYMVQLTDNVPPVQPTGLEGTVDSLGVVKLTWKNNPDDDIYGYRVFRSVSGNDEFSQRTKNPVTNTFFTDSISKKDLNASIFYKIVAIDLRQNQSVFSNIVELVKPDDIPPSIPVITQTFTTTQGIQLEWINSTSADVLKHIVYRFIEGDTAWVEMGEIPYKKNTRTSSYSDEEASTKNYNQYKVVAIDQVGNVSDPTLSVKVRALSATIKSGIKKIAQEVDYEQGKISLNWELPDNPVKLIKIYRRTKDVNYFVFETLEGDKTEFEDYGMKTGEWYAYRFKLIYKDGSVSSFSDEIKIEF